MKITTELDPKELASRILWLAWQAVNAPSGMGILQDYPDASEEEVLQGTLNAHDYDNFHAKQCSITDIYADYVFGRRMKLSFKIEKDTFIFPDEGCQFDYQAWATLYPTYTDLFNAAEDSLKKETVS